MSTSTKGKKARVLTLTPSQREFLGKITTENAVPRRVQVRAGILLSYADNPNVKSIASIYHVSSSTIAKLRDRFMDDPEFHIAIMRQIKETAVKLKTLRSAKGYTKKSVDQLRTELDDTLAKLEKSEPSKKAA